MTFTDIVFDAEVLCLLNPSANNQSARNILRAERVRRCGNDDRPQSINQGKNPSHAQPLPVNLCVS